MPVPVVVPPGVLVRVHVPVAGRPVRVTLPVATAQVGWVIAPTAGCCWCWWLGIDDSLIWKEVRYSHRIFYCKSIVS